MLKQCLLAFLAVPLLLSCNKKDEPAMEDPDLRAPSNTWTINFNTYNRNSTDVLQYQANTPPYIRFSDPAAAASIEFNFSKNHSLIMSPGTSRTYKIMDVAEEADEVAIRTINNIPSSTTPEIYHSLRASQLLQLVFSNNKHYYLRMADVRMANNVTNKLVTFDLMVQ